MKRYAGDLIHDLRERKLLPVALLLIAAIVAVPVFMLKPGSSATDSASTPPPVVTETESGAAISAQLLEPGDPQPSDLDSFNPKDPFAPPRTAKPPKAAEERATGASSAPTSGGGGGGGGATQPGAGDTPSAAPESTPDVPEPQPEQRSFAYALDLTFVGQRGERRYRNLQRLRMLPSSASPLIVFLGIEDGGGRATFLVDATVKLLGGEGSCTPSRSACATLSLEPGEQQTFADDQDRQYMIQVDQIREREVAKASSSTRAGIAQPSGVTRRFVMPSLVDVVSEVRR